MEKEEGWKDVKKKPKNTPNEEKKIDSNFVHGNPSNNNNFRKNNNKPLSVSSDAVGKSQKYESPSLKNKAVTFGNNNNSNTNGYRGVNSNNISGYRGGNTNSNNTNGYRGGNNTNNGSFRGGRGGRGGLNRRQDFINNIPDFANEEEKAKFIELREKCPHIMMPGIARRTAAIIRIDNFAEMFTSDEWIDLQLSGWKYERVVKPDDGEFEIPDDGYVYDLVEMKNKWGDYVLFKKVY
jgi:hypothetical protein